jgi:hypothetical protein
MASARKETHLPWTHTRIHRMRQNLRRERRNALAFQHSLQMQPRSRIAVHNTSSWGYDGFSMEPLPAPRVPGNTEAERMDNAVRKMFSVSKEDLLKEEKKWKRARERKKQAKKSA